MRVITDIASLRAELAGVGPLAFVPTMGSLHEGHLSLIGLARGRARRVAASIFVNRLQFAPSDDFDRYPRDFERDRALLEASGVDVLFAPEESTFYPEPQSYFVRPSGAGSDHDCRLRPRLLEGLATRVLKLFNCVQPELAVFGKKDYQQLIVVRDMVRQLALPIEIVAGETVREADGLAMSSRNAYLSARERAEAPRLYRVLREVAANRDCEAAVRKLEMAGWKPDYVEIRRRSDLAPPQPEDRALVVLGAARLGTTRLIDNVEF
jgi:pantoate--beta-alanine ligase